MNIHVWFFVVVFFIHVCVWNLTIDYPLPLPTCKSIIGHFLLHACLDVICYRMAGLWQSWMSSVGVCSRLCGNFSDGCPWLKVLTNARARAHTHTQSTWTKRFWGKSSYYIIIHHHHEIISPFKLTNLSHSWHYHHHRHPHHIHRHHHQYPSSPPSLSPSLSSSSNTECQLHTVFPTLPFIFEINPFFWGGLW